MKNLFFISLMLFICSFACATQKVKINTAVLRNSKIVHGNTSIMESNRTNVIYQDERTYIEADVIEITTNHIIVRFLISSADSRGMLIARGMPRLTIPLSNGLGMASLNCDGNEEHFTLIFSACPC